MADKSALRVPLTAESLSIEERIREANVRKAEGNDFFRKGDWQEALSSYESAVVFLPQKQNSPENRQSDLPQGQEESEESDELGGLSSENTRTTVLETAEVIQTSLVPESAEECKTLRAILNANIGACHVKLGEHKLAVEACTRALSDDPNYVKALQRRASSNEILDTWSSLSSAQEDYNTLLKLLSEGQEARLIQSKLQKLAPRLEASQKRETTEMVDKLKTLGNSILGNFGLSTDNFKFVPNGQGGYSVNFSQ